LTTTFYANEMIATQSQAGLTNSYQLDATGRVRQVTQSGTKEGTEVFHYSLASDSTAWTESGSTWTRDVTGIGGNLAAIEPSSGEASLPLTDLHGDVVATAALSGTAKEPTANFEFDEFGNPVKGNAGRFGWLGGKKRRTELPSGVIQMGLRSYIPAIGRFISADAVQGGSANSYDYADADPINNGDLSGSCSKKKCPHSKKTAQANRRGSRPRQTPYRFGPCHFTTALTDYGYDGTHTVTASVLVGCSQRATVTVALKIRNHLTPPPQVYHGIKQTTVINTAAVYNDYEGHFPRERFCFNVYWQESGETRHKHGCTEWSEDETL
jgi:RHS repeat-associated protein